MLVYMDGLGPAGERLRQEGVGKQLHLLSHFIQLCFHRFKILLELIDGRPSLLDDLDVQGQQLQVEEHGALNIVRLMSHVSLDRLVQVEDKPRSSSSLLLARCTSVAP